MKLFIAASFVLGIGCSNTELLGIEPDDDSIAAQSVEPDVLDSCQASDNVKIKCPADMVYVESDFCPDQFLNQKCLKWLDKPTCGKRDKNKKCLRMDSPRVCAEFAPSVCTASSKQLIHMNFCINKFEGANKAHEMPEAYKSYYDSETECKENGKRLCTADEWTKACEGSDNLPYGYGLKRDAQKCNIDLSYRVPSKNTAQQLTERYNKSGDKSECYTKWGDQKLFDMNSNVDEWVDASMKSTKIKSWLKGGHAYGGNEIDGRAPVRNRCRPATSSHDKTFSWYETSFRCCKDSE